jgi:hypothetical protein
MNNKEDNQSKQIFKVISIICGLIGVWCIVQLILVLMFPIY